MLLYDAKRYKWSKLTMKAPAKKIMYPLWVLNGYIGRKFSLDGPQKLTVLVTYYNPVRMKHTEPQVRNILKCDFVEKLIISNHNPDIRIEDRVRIRDMRLVLMNQEIRRGCGYRWSIANQFDPEYLVVVDDDILLFPGQLAKLFMHLVHEPEIPHGFTGFRQLENNEFEYRAKENITVDFLCEIYALTGSHLKQYTTLKNLVARNDTLTEMIENTADFMVISRTGSQNPKIHNVGPLLRCPTFNKTGVAVHKEKGFGEIMSEVGLALSNISVQDNEVHIPTH
jgi:hypothetical protein